MMGDAGGWWGWWWGGAQMEMLKARETQPAHKAVLAVTESDGRLPPFHRRHPFLPSSLLKAPTFSWHPPHHHHPPAAR